MMHLPWQFLGLTHSSLIHETLEKRVASRLNAEYVFPAPVSVESTLHSIESALRIANDLQEESQLRKRPRTEGWAGAVQRHNASVYRLLRDGAFLAGVRERVQWGQGPEHFARVLEAAVTYLSSEHPVLTPATVLAAAKDLVHILVYSLPEDGADRSSGPALAGLLGAGTAAHRAVPAGGHRQTCGARHDL